jgi:hypothetical protein
MKTSTLPPHRFCANGLFMPFTDDMSIRQFVVCESAAVDQLGPLEVRGLVDEVDRRAVAAADVVAALAGDDRAGLGNVIRM